MFSPRATPRLSKSRFLAGLQCEKRLYLEVYQRDLAAPVDPERRAIMDMGIDVGVLARSRFSGGVLVEPGYRQRPAALRRTAELVGDPHVSAIFEAAFEWEDTIVRVDVLERAGADAWNLIEVKATSKVKRVHVRDAALQAAVVAGAGVTLARISVMHVNTRYVYSGGDVDLQELFRVVDVTERANEAQASILPSLTRLREVLAAPVPPLVRPDAHCKTPYPCPFWEHCTAGKSERWIFQLPGAQQSIQDLATRGVELIDDIPEDVELTVIQRRVKENVEWISDELCAVLRDVVYPVHHLDFETFMPAIPLYPGTRPFRPLPMQWSNHIEYADGRILHEDYLCSEARDPRRDVAETVLASLRDEGTICVYSENERHLLLMLAEEFPDLKPRIARVVDRLWDLFEVLQTHYYHPAFRGSFSIKSVLPALLPRLTYENLEISNGAMASVIYATMILEETDLFERDRIAVALREYCARDTWGMVELRRCLLRKTAEGRAASSVS